jgi:hypothetical protein
MINFDPFSQWPLWILAKEIAEPTGSKSSQVRVHQRQISRQEPWVWDHRLTVLTGHIWQNEDVWKNSASFWDNPELGQFWPLFIGWLIHLQKIRQPMWVEGSLVDIVVVDPFPDPCKARGPWLKIRVDWKIDSDCTKSAWLKRVEHDVIGMSHGHHDLQ